jgi:hypothetical protein
VARIGGSLKLMSLRSAFLLFLALCRCRITTTFLVNKLYAEGYHPPFAKQVTKTFQVLVNHLPIDLQLGESFRQAALTAPLDGYLDDRFFACINIPGKLVFVL